MHDYNKRKKAKKPPLIGSSGNHLSIFSTQDIAIQLELGGSFGVRYSDSSDLDRFISKNSLRRREQYRLDIMVYFGVDRRSIGNDKIKPYYIDKISSPCLLISIYSGLLPASYILSRGTSIYHTSEVTFLTSASFRECANTV